MHPTIAMDPAVCLHRCVAARVSRFGFRRAGWPCRQWRKHGTPRCLRRCLCRWTRLYSVSACKEGCRCLFYPGGIIQDGLNGEFGCCVQAVVATSVVSQTELRVRAQAPHLAYHAPRFGWGRSLRVAKVCRAVRQNPLGLVGRTNRGSGLIARAYNDLQLSASLCPNNGTEFAL